MVTTQAKRRITTSLIPVVRDFRRICTILFGRSKLGKSTLAAHNPGAWFLGLEPGRLDGIEVAGDYARSWDEIKELSEDFLDGEHDRETMIIDPIEALQKMMAAAYCDKRGLQSPGQTGWGMVNAEMTEWLKDIKASGKGLWLISHQRAVTLKDGDGEYLRYVPAVSEGAREIIAGLADLILYYDLQGMKYEGDWQFVRVLRTTGSPYWIAGGISELAPTIPVGNAQPYGLRAYQLLEEGVALRKTGEIQIISREDMLRAGLQPRLDLPDMDEEKGDE